MLLQCPKRSSFNKLVDDKSAASCQQTCCKIQQFVISLHDKLQLRDATWGIDKFVERVDKYQ